MTALRCLALAALAAGLAGPVAAQQVCNPAIPASTPDLQFVDHGDGTVTDLATGLTWMREPLALASKWASALQTAESTVFAGHADWRLPNPKELASLVERRCNDPAINLAVFPGTPSEAFWTSSTVQQPLSGEGLFRAWVVRFDDGWVYGSADQPLRLRLVRDGF